jgi:glycosyltransferase involved in cell wall biosynthesis
MKIGLSSNALKHSGGLERYAMDLVRGFVAAGVTPEFFARRFDPSLPETAMVHAHRINVSFLPGKWRDGWFSRRLRAARRKAGVDVLIGCNRVDSSDIAICGGTHLGFLRATGKRRKNSDVRQIALERSQYEHAQRIVAHSPLMRDELRELYGVADHKIDVLYPPVDDARFSPVGAAERAALRKRFGFADHEIVLLFPSSSHDRKGLPLIETALRGLDAPFVLAVAGRAPERVDARVRHLGYAKQIEDCYRAADFTILASKYEPFGLVGIESVMCGTPVIFPTTLGCCAAIAPHAKHTFEPNDVADLRATLERIAHAAHAARERAEAGSAAGAAAPADVARGAVLYDTRIASHVDALLRAAQRIVEHR